MSRAATLFKNIVAFGLNQSLGKLLGLFLLPVYTRYLLPSDYGIVELFNAWVCFVVPVVSLGLHDAGFRFYWDGRERDWHARLAGSALAVYIVIAAALALLVGTGAVFSPPGKNTGRLFLLEGYSIYFLVVVYALLMSVGMFFQNIIRARNQLFLFVLISNTGALAGAVAGLYLVVVKGWGYAGVVWGLVAACVITAFFSILASRDLLLLKYFKKPDWLLAKKLLLYGLPMIPNAMGWTAIMFFDRLLLGWLTGPEAVGLYGVAMRFASIIFLWNQVFYMAWQYVALSEMEAGDRREFSLKVLTGYTVLTAVLVVSLSAAVPFLYPPLIGASFHGGAVIIPILASSAVFHGISSFLGLNYIISKKTERALWTTLLGVFSNIAVCLWLIPKWNINGAAWGMLAAYVVMSLVRLWDDRSEGVDLVAGRLLWYAMLLAAACPLAAAWSYRSWQAGLVILISSTIVFYLWLSRLAAGSPVIGLLKGLLISRARRPD